jgi:hypothetical protein
MLTFEIITFAGAALVGAGVILMLLILALILTVILGEEE